MAGENVTVSAQLGCGALILVGIAAYIGALAGSDRSDAQPSESSLPRIFVEGNFVKRMATGEELSIVFEVIAVDSPWVRLKADPKMTFSSMMSAVWSANPDTTPEDVAAALENADNPVLKSLEMRFAGEWWMNTATTTDLWQVVPKIPVNQ